LVGVVLLFAAPSGWQNALFGFQSQVYFTSLLAVASCVGMIRFPPLSTPWWLGLAAASLALFSNAAGALIAPAILGATLLRPTLADRRAVLAGLLLAILLAFALATRVTHPGHVSFHARTAAQFLGTLTHGLSWPHIGSGWMWIGLQAPLVILVALRLRQRVALTTAERCALGLAAFSVLHAAAIAYSRGGGLQGFQLLSRYQDPMLPGATAQLYAALVLACTFNRAGRLTLIGWSALLAVGMITLSEAHLTLNLPYKRAMDRTNLAAARAFLDAPVAERMHVESRLAGLHPEPSTVRKVLEDSVLQTRLPSLLKTPLPPSASTPPFIILDGLIIGLAGAVLFIGLGFRRLKL
jgi:hypothetical protein